MGEMDGLTAVVTGGASGIGLATAELLAASGANVAILDRKTDDAPSTPPPKGAVLSLTLAMAADHISDGSRVNAVNPGTADASSLAMPEHVSREARRDDLHDAWNPHRRSKQIIVRSRVVPWA